jgi:hypothetical protein
MPAPADPYALWERGFRTYGFWAKDGENHFAAFHT